MKDSINLTIDQIIDMDVWEASKLVKRYYCVYVDGVDIKHGDNFAANMFINSVCRLHSMGYDIIKTKH